MSTDYTVRGPGTLTIDSDWASIVLITTDAVIERIPGFVYPPDAHFTGTQLFVGQQDSFRFEKKEIPFIIAGNGKPIDVATAHGDASGGTEPGNVDVKIGPINLFNNVNNGDGVNVKVFPKVPLPFN